MEDLRRQSAAQTESAPVWRIRFFAAGLSIGFGFIGLVLVLPMARGVVSWAAAPGAVLLVAGGVLGIRAQRADAVAVSRRLGRWAAVATFIGLVVVAAVLALA